MLSVDEIRPPVSHWYSSRKGRSIQGHNPHLPDLGSVIGDNSILGLSTT